MDVVNLSPEPESRLSLRFEPYYELPMCISELRALVQSQGSTEPLNIGGLPPVRAKWGGGCAPSPFG